MATAVPHWLDIRRRLANASRDSGGRGQARVPDRFRYPPRSISVFSPDLEEVKSSSATRRRVLDATYFVALFSTSAPDSSIAYGQWPARVTGLNLLRDSMRRDEPDALAAPLEKTGLERPDPGRHRRPVNRHHRGMGEEAIFETPERASRVARGASRDGLGALGGVLQEGIRLPVADVVEGRQRGALLRLDRRQGAAAR